MKSKKNKMPIAPFNLREQGPTSEADLKKQHGYFRYAHGKGADRRATLDRDPCPHCKARVEWTLTYKREAGAVVPYVYARCRAAPKSHRWDFTHWSPKTKPVISPKSETPEIPAPHPSVDNWIDVRITTLQTELEKLQKIRDITHPMPPVPTPATTRQPAKQVDGHDHSQARRSTRLRSRNTPNRRPAHGQTILPKPSHP